MHNIFRSSLLVLLSTFSMFVILMKNDFNEMKIMKKKKRNENVLNNILQCEHFII